MERDNREFCLGTCRTPDGFRRPLPGRTDSWGRCTRATARAYYRRPLAGRERDGVVNAEHPAQKRKPGPTSTRRRARRLLATGDGRAPTPRGYTEDFASLPKAHTAPCSARCPSSSVSPCLGEIGKPGDPSAGSRAANRPDLASADGAAVTTRTLESAVGEAPFWG
jgi:hypothetical protein